MKKIEKYYPLFSIVFVFIVGILLSYSYFPTETKSNALMAFVTFLVGVLVVYLYIKQKEDTKRDAAKIILQEIRRAEDIISDYKQNGGYQFAKKIIATNSWSGNIHLFVGDLDNDELDRISDLYSTGEYLDSLVRDISEITLQAEIDGAKKIIDKQLSSPGTVLPGLQSDPKPVGEVIITGLPPVWKKRLDVISLGLEPIYNSTIVWKLKQIARFI